MKRAAKEGFPLIPEGEQIVLIREVDESEYEKFQKIIVILEDASGTTARENFSFVKEDGTENEVADRIFTQMGRAALGDQTLDEIDTEELAGKYILVEIEHNEGSKGGKFANVSKWIGPAKPFARKQSTATKATAPPAAQTAVKRSAAEILAAARAKAKK